MTTSNTITKNDLKAIVENICLATVAYGRGEVGEIKAYGGSTIPTGWLLCDGQAVSRTTYSELFSVIGTTYGSGDGSTTFNVPDLRGRFPIGSGTGTASDATERTLGQSGGSERVTLNVDQIPSHAHNYQRPVLMYGSGGNSTWPGSGSSAMGSDTWGYSGVASTGGGQSHGNMPPYMAINYIIYAKNTTTVTSPQIDLFYPVGSYYETSDSTFDPNVQWGGTWVLETAGQVHVSSGTGYTINGALTNTTDGGASTVSLQTTNLPAHTHLMVGYDTAKSSNPTANDTINLFAASGASDLPYSLRPTTSAAASLGKSGSTGSGTAHNNMQPYIVVNRWHRTA